MYTDNTQYPGSGDYQGIPSWAPDGYIDMQDALAQQMALVNPFMVSQLWSRELAFHEIGDEYYGGSPYAYIPTETQVKSMIALVNINTVLEGPLHQEDPSMNSLLQSLYSSASQLWTEIRRAGGTGW